MCRGGSIDWLSIEILGKIFGWLDDDDLISVSSVCRLWYDVVNIYLLQRKRYAILRPQGNDFKPIRPLQRLSLIGFNDERFQQMKHLFGDINRLHIGYDDDRLDRCINDDTLSMILDSCTNLKTISFKNVLFNDKIVCTILKKGFHKLNSVTFECNDSSLRQDDIKNSLDTFFFSEFKFVVKKSKDETNLYAKYPFPNTITSTEIPKHITKLQIDCTGLTKNSYNCLKYCTKLQSIKLLNAYDIEDDVIESYFNDTSGYYLPELRKVSFSDANKISIAGWRFLFHCDRIESVTLIRCGSGLSDDVFKDAKAGYRRLDLDLHNCKRVTEEGLISAIQSTERISLALDYNQDQIERLEKFITLGKAPRLRCFVIAIQRLNATSYNVSSHLNKFKTTIASYSNERNIQFDFKEILTKSERSFQPAISINSQ